MSSKQLLFGTGGIPRSTKGTSSILGIKRIRELGLDCMELEFVQGVRMSENGAKNVLEAAIKEEVALSVHAPYYINLNSYEEEKLKASLERIYQAARIGSLCGAESIVLHAGFYQKSSKKHTFESVSKALKILTKQKSKELCPVLIFAICTQGKERRTPTRSLRKSSPGSRKASEMKGFQICTCMSQAWNTASMGKRST